MTTIGRRMAATLALAAPTLAAVPAAAAAAVPSPGLCSPPVSTGEATGAPEYYAIELVPTRRVPGTREASGQAAVTFPASPFGVTVTPGGVYVQELRVRVDGLRPRDPGGYAVWVTTPQLDEIRFLGFLDAEGAIEGTVQLNKFLVVVSLEEDVEALGERWRGPIVLRGMSRSGRMHTMAGHGPYQAEPCVKYGY